MKNFTFFIITVSFIFFIVLAVFRNKTSVNVSPTESSPPINSEQPRQIDMLIVNLVSQNNSGESGSATLKNKNEESIGVAIVADGAPNNVAQPSHIHTGTCEKVGGVMFSLNPVVNGISETSLDALPTQMKDIRLRSGMLIDIHKSEAEPDLLVACGEVTIPTP